jgi:hypothetical protein
MAILLKVKWIDLSDQPDPCLRIRHIGGSSRDFEWRHTNAQAIQSIEQKMFCYYVENGGHSVKLEVGLSPNGSKFLKTQADGNQAQLLLNLPKFPKPELR